MKKIKVTYICEALGGGVRKHLVDLLDHIDKNKYEVHVIHGVNRMDTVFIDAKNRLDNVKFYPVAEMEREISVKKDFAALMKVVGILKNIKPDVVHCHSSKAGVLGRVAAKYLRIKKIYYTPHGYIFQNPTISNKKMKLFTFIEKALANNFSTKVIHVSKGEEAEAIKHNILPVEKSTVVYNGMDIPEVKDEGIKDIFHIVTIARMDDQKNPWEAIKIIEGLLNQYPNIMYTYVGDGKYYNEIAEYVNSNKLDNHIKLPGFLDNPYEVLKGADLFLLSSLYEGLPYALIEAMAFKVPLLASDVTGNNELVTNDYNGFLYKLNNIEEGRAKLKVLINNKDLLGEMSNNAYKHFINNFTIEKMVNAYDKLYSGD
ncbi:glycosyltransferase family 1 protein [Bacillus sp. UMB0899]|nr:glycosyltransferase family 1 protein [Bacillus sp. UMB0899]